MKHQTIGILLSAGILCACEGRLSERAATAGEGDMIIALPAPQTSGGRSLAEALAARRSIRSFTDRTLTRAEYGQLLWAAQGTTDNRRGLRTAPSAGATYPLETYAVTPEGVYRYRSDAHRLERVSAGDRRSALAEAALGQAAVRTAPLIVAFSAIETRTTRRYGDRGHMYIHMEAGHAAQNLHLQAVALGLGSVPVGAFNPEQAARALGIPAAETLLYLVPLGEPSE